MEKEIVIDGLKIVYLEFGSGPETLIFLHGWLGRPNLAYFLNQWFPNRFRVIAPYFPGHGKSAPLDKDFSFEKLQLLTNNFLNSFSSQKLILIGYSTGATLAWNFAQNFPQTLKKAVLIGLYSKRCNTWQLIKQMFKVLKIQIIDKPFLHAWKLEKKIKILGPQWRNIQCLVTVAKQVCLDNNPVNFSFPLLILFGQQDDFAPTSNFLPLLKSNYISKSYSGSHHWWQSHLEEFKTDLQAFLIT